MRNGAALVALAGAMLIGACHGKPAEGDAAPAKAATPAAAKEQAAVPIKGWALLLAQPQEAVRELNAQGFAYPDYAFSDGSFRSVAPPMTLAGGNLLNYQMYGSQHLVDGLRFAVEIVDPANADAALEKLAGQLATTFDKLSLPGSPEIKESVPHAQAREWGVKDASFSIARYPYKDGNPQHYYVIVNIFRIGVAAPLVHAGTK